MNDRPDSENGALDEDDDRPVRHRGENLLEEARILQAGSGLGGGRIFQAFLYLAVLTVLSLVVWWVLAWNK
jgi:hypothetical protein